MLRKVVPTACLFLMLCVATACSKEEGTAGGGPSPSASVGGGASAGAGADAGADADAGANAGAATPSATGSAAPSATGSIGRKATKIDAGLACGDKPLPPCPLYAWMKANTSAAMSAQDFDGLAAALTKTATFAPAGYTHWVSTSKDGADAARAQSLDGVKAACRGCHNQYKDRYKKEMRDRPI